MQVIGNVKKSEPCLVQLGILMWEAGYVHHACVVYVIKCMPVYSVAIPDLLAGSHCNKRSFLPPSTLQQMQPLIQTMVMRHECDCGHRHRYLSIAWKQHWFCCKIMMHCCLVLSVCIIHGRIGRILTSKYIQLKWECRYQSLAGMVLTMYWTLPFSRNSMCLSQIIIWVGASHRYNVHTKIHIVPTRLMVNIWQSQKKQDEDLCFETLHEDDSTGWLTLIQWHWTYTNESQVLQEVHVCSTLFSKSNFKEWTVQPFVRATNYRMQALIQVHSMENELLIATTE